MVETTSGRLSNPQVFFSHFNASDAACSHRVRLSGTPLVLVPLHRDEVRQPIPAEPGQIERYDCEYKRNGTANLFIFLDVHRPWRRVKVTDSRAAVDFAACMRELADVHNRESSRQNGPRLPLGRRPTNALGQ
ncbi:hypothetical protein V1277_006988 [Bradyrhizobium sp. AZCC 1588]